METHPDLGDPDALPLTDIFRDSPMPPAATGKKILTQEQKDKMAVGRRRAFEEKKRLREEEKLAAKSSRARPTAAAASTSVVQGAGDPLGFTEEVVPDYSGRKPKSLLDLFAQFPVGNGKYYVQVNRLSPKIYMTQHVSGVQREIWNPMTDEEFATYYGGGEYELRVYGSGPGDGTGPDGQARLRAFTDPIKYNVPGHPNLESGLRDTEDTMPNQQRIITNGVRRAPSLPMQSADVDMVRANNEHAETMDERNRREAHEERARTARVREEESKVELEKAKLAEESRQRDLDRAAESNQRQLELVRELADAKNKGGVSMSDLVTLLAAKNGNSDNTREIAQMAEQHKNEIARLNESHARALEQERSRADMLSKTERNMADVRVESLERRVKDTEDRANVRIREIEEQRDRRVREIEATNSERMRSIEAEASRRISEIESRNLNERAMLIEQHNSRVSDMNANHERELKTREAISDSSSKMLEHAGGVEVRTLKNELTRLTGEVDRYRAEAEANKDWLSKMKEFQELAEAMGYSNEADAPAEGDEPKDWKTMAGSVGLQLVKQLPELARAAGDALQKARAAGQQIPVRHVPGVATAVAPQQQIHGMPQPRMFVPPPFASEDGVDFASNPSAPPPPPPRPNFPQQQIQLSQAEQQIAAAEQAQMAQAVPVAPPAQAIQQQIVQQQNPPEVVQQPPPAQAPAPQSDLDAFDFMVHQLAQSYDANQPTAEVAKTMADAIIQNGAAAQVRMMPFEQVVAMIGDRPFEEAKKLVRRDGQKYLKEVWEAILAQLAGVA